MKLVSCVIPTYRRADLLSRAIDSVLAQTYSNIEVLVVDDNIPRSAESNDVKEIVIRYSRDKRVKYVGQEEHINGAVARNKGICASQGEYIAFLDDDDEWLPLKIEKQVEYLDQHEEIGGATTLYSIFSGGRRIRRYPAYSNEDLQFMILSRQISMYTSTFIGRRNIIDKFGGFNTKLVRNQDLQFFADFLNYAGIHPISEYLVSIYEDSNINRKGLKQAIDVQMEFFRVVDGTIKKYDREKQKRIFAGNYFEIVVEAFKARQIGIALEYLAKIGPHLICYKELYNRYKRKKESIRLA